MEHTVLSFQTIRVLEVVEVGFGKDSDLFTVFPAVVRWCDPDLDLFPVEVDQSLISQDNITVQSWTRGLKPGIYEKIPGSTDFALKEEPLVVLQNKKVA